MMTISIQCVHCQKRYNAPATMAGKKVKCKHCGKVFAIPAEGAGEGAAGLSAMGADTAGGTRAGGKTGSRGGAAVGRSGGGAGKLGGASAGYASKMARSGEVDEIEIAGAGPFQNLRPSIPHDFPGADTLDKIVPVILLIIGLGWLSLMAVSSNSTSQSYIGPVRLVVYLLLYAAVAFPISYIGVKMAARKCRFALPPSPRMRGFAAFALPFALALVCQLSGQSLAMLIVGTMVGAVLTCATVWFLFRVQPQEMPTTLGTSAGTFAAGVAATAAVLTGIDFATYKVNESSGTNQLKASPMGMLAWDLPVTDGTKKEDKQRTRPSGGEQVAINTTNPTTNESPAGADTTTTTTTTVDLGGDPATRQSATQKSPNTQIAMNVNPDGSPVNATPVTPPDPGLTTRPATTQSAPVEPPKVEEKKQSAFIAKITPIIELQPGDVVLNPPGPTNVVTTMAVGPGKEVVTVYASTDGKKIASNAFDIEKGLPPQTPLVSPNGDLVARLVEWPKLGVQVWSMNQGKELKLHAVPTPAPELLTFAGSDALVLRAAQPQGGLQVLGVLNVRTGGVQVPNGLKIIPPDRLVVSPDGQRIAVAGVEQAGGPAGRIDVWNLSGVQPPKPMRTSIPAVKWTKPTAMAFGPNNTIAAFFEEDGKGLLHVSPTSGVQPGKEYAFRELPYPPGLSNGFNGRGMEFVHTGPGSAVVILFARAVVDPDSGAMLGDLGLENPRWMRVLDKDTLLVEMVHDGKPVVAQVELNVAEIAKARAEARR